MPPGLVVKAICTVYRPLMEHGLLSAYDSWVPSTATGYGNMTLGVQSGRSLSTAANVTAFGGNAYITLQQQATIGLWLCIISFSYWDR